MVLEILKTFLDIFDSLMVLLSSETFWTAIGAIGTVGALYFIYKQIAHTRNVAAYEFLRREDDRFCSEKMVRYRSKLAQILILKPNNYQAIDEYADPILSYFEDIGSILRQRLAPRYLVWTMNCFYVLNYWKILAKFIDWVRNEQMKDPTYYCEFEYLYKMMLKCEKKYTRKAMCVFNELEFLEQELHAGEEVVEAVDIRVRPFSLLDLNRVMEIEQASFNNDEAYSRSEFEKLNTEHPEGFFVAEILGEVIGYVIGYISNDIGEFDSLAVDPRLRRLGVGRKLTELILEIFRRKSVKTCSLEVSTENTSAISFYENMGFQIVEVLKDYYAVGRDAYLMKMNIGGVVQEG